MKVQGHKCDKDKKPVIDQKAVTDLKFYGIKAVRKQNIFFNLEFSSDPVCHFRCIEIDALCMLKIDCKGLSVCSKNVI